MSVCADGYLSGPDPDQTAAAYWAGREREEQAGLADPDGGEPSFWDVVGVEDDADEEDETDRGL